ncbi:MAG: hypothetical protein V3R76_00055 [Gammaproteobacteria bacterium]
MGALFLGNALASQDNDSARLLERIQVLEERLAAVESRFTFASFMPDFAERFHVMHRSGEAGDWAVASHELMEMMRLSQLSPSINADQGKLMEAMMKPNFEALRHAIEDSNQEKFNTALAQTIDSCNACHTASASRFIEVQLNARESISLRHPHKFIERQVQGGHAHSMPSGMSGKMMTTEPASDEHHDDAGKPEHHHDDADSPAHND